MEIISERIILVVGSRENRLSVNCFAYVTGLSLTGFGSRSVLRKCFVHGETDRARRLTDNLRSARSVLVLRKHAFLGL